MFTSHVLYCNEGIIVKEHSVAGMLIKQMLNIFCTWESCLFLLLKYLCDV